MEKSTAYAFVTRVGKGWVEGEIFRLSQDLIDLNWNDAPTSLDEWQIEGSLDLAVGVYKFDMFFTSDDEYGDAYLCNPRALWVDENPTPKATK